MYRFAFLLAFAPAFAQDLPDPGRRVIEEERHAEQLKRSEAEEKRSWLVPAPERKRDAKACEAARLEMQMYCGAPYSPKSHSMRCAESRAHYEQTC